MHKAGRTNSPAGNLIRFLKICEILSNKGHTITIENGKATKAVWTQENTNEFVKIE